MAYDFGIEYVKGNTIPRVDALSGLQFNKDQKVKTNIPDEEILHWVETDILSLQRLISNSTGSIIK